MKKGFTLLELVVVTVVIGILISLGVPQFVNVIEKSRAAEGVSILGAIRSAQLRQYATQGAYAAAGCRFNTPTDNCGLDITIGTLRFFDRPLTGTSNAAQLGTIVRLGGAYTLSIAEAGPVTCDGSCAGLGI